MAFNFNWQPLTADADFYRRARDLLTTALNKSPKPPIIVDDILVTELNLGSVPPDLELLEVGNLAEDRFQGIFKMCYSGDAFLTLKTRVQANPLNTYLFSKPMFTSPQPLAAADGLTIPLSITLSEIKLSAFIILVFSKQKGLTIVFRNDPLESLKVSSTFDSIQFVRDYLQRTIEGKLRDLMMDELPAIIHRLSLQLWCPDQLPKDELESAKVDDETAVDPLASPPLDAVDSQGNLLGAVDISSLSLDGRAEVQSLFSQKNLVRLATLTNSHRTLSLFTPPIRDVVFRAWATPPERSDPTNSPPLLHNGFSRAHSYSGSTAKTYTFSDLDSSDRANLPSRPSLLSVASAGSVPLSSSRLSRPFTNRKKKRRVVDLRKKSHSEANSEAGDTASETASVDAPMSEPLMTPSISEEPEDDLEMFTPSRVRFRPTVDRTVPPPRMSLPIQQQTTDSRRPTLIDSVLDQAKLPQDARNDISEKKIADKPATSRKPDSKASLKQSPASVHGAFSDTNSTILEQAWISKMAGEIARRVYEEKSRNPHLWAGGEDAPPPAYEPRL